MGIAAVLTALSVTPTTTSSQTSALEDYGGLWQFSGSRRDRRALEVGIDRVADQLNLFIREIARSEMRRRIQPENRVGFRMRSETRVEVSIDDWGPMAFELGGPPRRVRGPGGDDIRAAVALRHGRLVHREIHGQGNRTNVFSLSPDRRHMVMSASIHSDQLPDQIRYRLNYRRLR